MISDKMGRQKLPLEHKYADAAFLYALIQLFPTIKLSLPHAMHSKGLTDEESKNAGLVKRVQRIAGCKETCEVALQALLEAAAQVTLHTTNIPKDISTGSTTTDITISSLSDESTDSPPTTSKRKQAPGSVETRRDPTHSSPPAFQIRNHKIE